MWEYWCFQAFYEKSGALRGGADDWVVKFSDGTAWVGMDRILGRCGQAGWELVAVVPQLSEGNEYKMDVTIYRFFFKRPKQDSEEAK